MIIYFLVTVLWLNLGVVGSGLLFALWQRHYPKLRTADFRYDRWSATVAILGGPGALALGLVLIWSMGYYGWLWPWCHEALEESNLADPR